MHGQFTPAVSLGEISSVNKQSLRSCKIWRVAYTLYFTDNCTVNADYNYAHRSEYAFVRTILADETKKKNNWKIIRQRSKQTKQDETVEGRVLPMEAEFTRRWEPCQWCNCETQFKLKVTVSTWITNLRPGVAGTNHRRRVIPRALWHHLVDQRRTTLSSMESS